MKKAVIIGGGISGIAAATLLSRSGCKVEIHEASSHLGGRVYSFTDKISGLNLDNGQHIMMGCYKYTLDLLKKIHSIDKVEIQKSLHLDYLDNEKNRFSLSCKNYPAPLHILSGLLKLPFVSSKDIFNFLNFGLQLYLNKIFKSGQNKSALDILTETNQSNLISEFLWHPIVVSAMNAKPKNVSGELFLDTMFELFCREKSYSNIILPKEGLSQIFAEPAAKTIKSNGGEIITGSRISGLEFSNGKILNLITTKGETIAADLFISSLPPHALLKIKGINNIIDINRLSKFSYSPIIGIYILLKKKIISDKILFLLKTKLQVLFNKTFICGLDSKTQLLSLIISAADNFVNMNSESIKEMAVSELSSIVDDFSEDDIINIKIIKEKRATVVLDSSSNSLRPSAKTIFDNFYLIGDWTNTGLPATIESAVKSAYILKQILIDQK